MKTTLSALFALTLAASAQDTGARNSNRSEAGANGERAGEATVLHRADVMQERGGGRHLWPLLNTPEARMNYFEVTGRGALHFHPEADHRLYVLEGTVLVTCGATTTKCTVGDFIIIPRGVRHCYDVSAPGEKALLLTLDSPPYDPKKTVNVEPKNPEKLRGEFAR